MSANDVLDFWFSERARERWFASTPAFDDELRARFAITLDQAASGTLHSWSATSAGALALVIVLDQLPRNLFRDSPRAFAHDHQAYEVATGAIERGDDMVVPLDHRLFFYLPFEHSERLVDQERSVALFSRWAEAHAPGPDRAEADSQMVYVHRYHAIIQRFGRFPHRNIALGRASTPDELAFLQAT